MFFVLGISISVFLVFLLLIKKEKSSADKVLLIWLLLLFVHQVYHYQQYTGWLYEYPYLLGWDFSFPILSLAYDCSFNSKSTFNKHFKENTQKTPTEYFKSQSTDS